LARSKENKSRGPVKVAIVGGGCAGLSAAWELSKLPGYEVHVYEKSWRLGGKGASGRDAKGRIKEHGLHTWLGFYDNAFRMIRDCYAEVERRGWGPGSSGSPLAHGSMDAAFVPEPHIGVAIPEPSTEPAEKWIVWSGLLPPAKGLPGDPLDEDSNPFTLSNYLLRCVELLKTLMVSVIGPADAPRPGDARPEERSKVDAAIEKDFAFDPISEPEALIDVMARYLRTGALTTASGLLQAVTILEKWLQRMNLSPQVPGTPLRFMEAVAAQTRKFLRDFVGIDRKLRWKTEILDIVLTITVGLYRDRVLFEDRGFDAINHIDYRDWLKQHGATYTALNSQFLTGIYDLTFAYRKGDRQRPALAAGVALRGALRMFFTYRGSMFWRMRSGMGDAVFAPLYRVLQLRDRQVKAPDGTVFTARAVQFHFLHELNRVDLKYENDERYITGLHFDIKGNRAKIDTASRSALDAFGCWPDNDRLFAKTRPPKSTGVKLKVGGDFDAVIFATGFDDFVRLLDTPTFLQYMPSHWSEMRTSIETVATQAAQVWMEQDLEELGWQRGSGIFTAFEPPFETWADMTQTLATERAWRDANRVSDAEADRARSVAYFCGVLAEADVDAAGARIEDKVRNDLDALLSSRIRPLWPAPFDDDLTASHCAVERHVRANTEGADRYTLALPGTIEHRISPLDRSVLNMTIAGDWTASGLDAGCVESAVMSGMLAAFSITNEQPPLRSIVGYDHP
jgi:uncharacterized protein with NAD-binding domain and iron-sulfur cluster